jgi:parallel beta-helix repeat protein
MNKLVLLTTISFFLFGTALQAKILYVGPNETYKTINAVMWDVVDNDTIIVRDGNYPRSITIRNHGLTLMAENKHKAVIGNGEEGVFQIRRNNVTINGFRFNSLDAPGIVVGGAGEDTKATNCLIKNNMITARKMGILVSDFAENCIIDSNIITNCDENGIHHNGRGINTISNNRIEGNQHGIVISEAFTGSAVITGDTIIKNRNNGVDIQRPNVTLRRNIISENTENGILVRNASDYITIGDSNLIESNGFSGIDIGGYASVKITRNTIKKNERYGIFTGGSSIIEENAISENKIHGIENSTGAIFTWIKNNHVTDNVVNGLQLYDKAYVRGNTISGNGIMGIAVDGTSGTVQVTDSNNISSNTQHGIFISPNSSALILDNNITYNGTGVIEWEDFSGIFVDGSGTIERNNINNNHGSGITVESNSANTSILANPGINSNREGIVMYGSAEVLYNTINNNETEGIWVGPASDIVIQSNTVSGNDRGIVVHSEAFNISLVNCEISGNQQGLVTRGDIKVRRNTIEENTEVGVRILNAGVDLGQDNDVEGGGNTIRKNTPWNIISHISDTVYACRNHWEIMDPAVIDTLIRDDDEDAMFGPVIFSPVLSQDVTGIESFFPVARSNSNGILEKIYPNPFQEVTNIRYGLSSPSRVTMRVADISGRIISTLIPGLHHDAGTYSIQWNGQTNTGKRAGSGFYLITMMTDSNNCSRIVQILK